MINKQKKPYIHRIVALILFIVGMIVLFIPTLSFWARAIIFSPLFAGSVMLFSEGKTSTRKTNTTEKKAALKLALPRKKRRNVTRLAKTNQRLRKK